MKSILIDTSVWIEFFAKKSKLDQDQIVSIKECIREDEVVLVEPIRAELLSGHFSPGLREGVTIALDSLKSIDLDWNSKTVWNDIIGFADLAKSNKLPIPGVVDRMILLSCLTANAYLATYDRSLATLAKKAEVALWFS